MFLCLTCYLIKRFLNSCLSTLLCLRFRLPFCSFTSSSLSVLELSDWVSDFFPFDLADASSISFCTGFFALFSFSADTDFLAVSSERFPESDSFSSEDSSAYILYKMNLQLAIQLIFFCILFLSHCLPPKQISFTIFLFFRMINKNIQK